MSVVRGLLKLVAVLSGALVTIVCLMAVVGSFTGNGWARLGGALVVGLGVPLLGVDLVMTRVSPEKLRGFTIDIVAAAYLVFALAFVGAAHGVSQPMLTDEAHRLDDASWPKVARVAYLLAGEAPAPAAVATAGSDARPEAKPEPVASGSDKPAALRVGDGKERTPAQIFTEFAPGVVTILVKGSHGEGGGTGFVLDSAGTIATAYHVVDGAAELKVKLMDGTVADSVEVLAENQPQDLALLRIKTAAPLTIVALGDSDKITVGERAVSIGNPVGLEHTLTDGLISARRVIDGRKLIQMSTPVSPGNSGGPLFNSRGEVIGVTVMIYSGGTLLAQNLNLAVPVNDLRAMIHTDYPGRHKVGEGFSSGAGRW
jgi:serine protease Do